MSIEASHLLKYVIRPALANLAEYEPRMQSEAAERLLLLTAAHESRLGRWLVQRNGPAKSIYQMEPPAIQDATETLAKLWQRSSQWPPIWAPDGGGDLISNLHYATVIARCYYWRQPAALPNADNPLALAEYWHTYWCRGCKGTAEQALSHYQWLVLARIGSWA